MPTYERVSDPMIIDCCKAKETRHDQKQATQQRDLLLTRVPCVTYEMAIKLYADKELIPGRLFIAGNLVHEPEAVLAKEFDPDTEQFTKWERCSDPLLRCHRR